MRDSLALLRFYKCNFPCFLKNYFKYIWSGLRVFLQAEFIRWFNRQPWKNMTHQEILRKVEWRDLKSLSFKEILIENNLTIPWFLISMTFAYFGYYILALPFSAFFFLTGLRQVHNGFHNSLGTNKFLTWLSLYINSILMMTSIHAVKFNHIRHHKYCLTEEDYEGKSAGMTWYGSILYGPVHMFLIHKVTLQIGNKDYKRNVILELISIVIFVSIVFFFRIDFGLLSYYIKKPVF